MSTTTTKPRVPKQIPKRTRTRLALLRAALDHLGREDGRVVRIEEIVSSVGMTRTTFYNHFVSREEFFNIVAFELSHHFNAALLPIVNLEVDEAKRVGFATRYYLQKAREDQKWGWAIVNVSLNGPKLFGEETFNEATGSIVNGTKNGTFDLDDPETGRDLLLGSILSAFMHILHRAPTAAYSEEITFVMLRGLGVPTPKARRIATTKLKPLPEYASPFSLEAAE